MANKLFQETQQNNMMNNLQSKLQQMNIPKDIQNNPHDIVNYLVQSGKINQNALNRAIQIAQKMGIKL